MNPLELDDYREKEVAELASQTGFDPEPVSNCSQFSVTWGGGWMAVSRCWALSCFAHFLFAS